MFNQTLVNKSSINNGIILSISIILSSIVTYFIMGIGAAMWSALSALNAYNLFNSSKNYKNYFYTFLGAMVILLAIYCGHLLDDKYTLYLFLILICFTYYQITDINPIIDLSIKYIIVFVVLGTMIPAKTITDLSVSLIIGTLVSLITFYVLSNQKYTTLHLNRGLIVNRFFTFRKNIFYRTCVYATFLILCLVIPRHYEMGHYYWSLLTFVFVLTPKAEKVITLTLQRTLGSILAVLLLFSLFNTPLMPYIGLFCILFLAFLLPIASQINYTLTTVCTTGIVLGTIEMSDYWLDPNYHLLFERITETLIGGLFAIVCSLILKLLRTQ